MNSTHAFEGHEGGRYRISHGRFVKLVPNEFVVEVDEFETADPALRGEMTITITLADANGGTDLVAVHDGLPSGVSLARLATLVKAVS